MDHGKKPTADFSDVQGGSSSTAPEPASRPGPTTYTVMSGDSLSRIARRLWGNAALWPRLFEANRSTIKDPDLIYPGQVLTIPDADTPSPDADTPSKGTS